MGHAVRQFEKEVSLILDQQQEKYFLTDALKKACDRLALQKMATASRLCWVSRQNQSFVSIEN